METLTTAEALALTCLRHPEHLARPFGEVDDLTEPEGRALEAFRTWSSATPEQLCNLRATQTLLRLLVEADTGKLEDAAEFFTLSSEQVEALAIVADLRRSLAAEEAR